MTSIDTLIDISANQIAWGWETPEDFVKDMRDKKYILNNPKVWVKDLSGEALLQQKQLFEKEKKEMQKQMGVELSKKIIPEGSNANWGRITQSEELQGAFLEEVGINGVKTPNRCAEYYQDINDYLLRCQSRINFSLNDHARIIEEGELLAPIVRAIELEEDDDTVSQVSCFCKGCSKTFATKGSLKRHHDRKKSCKDLCEEKEKIKEEEMKPVVEVPAKPYIVDWVEELLLKSISGDSDKPYCKHCDVEFANKSNLNKHLSKSVACDKLAKQAFLDTLSKI